MEEITLIVNNRSWVKVFNPIKNLSKPSPTINAMEIAYGYV